MTFSRVLRAATMAALVSIPAAKAQLGEMPRTGGVGGPPDGPGPDEISRAAKITSFAAFSPKLKCW